LGGWSLGNLSVIVELGDVDDTDIDVVVKTKDINLGGKGAGITVKEGSNAEEVLYWPGVSLSNPDRRSVIYDTTLGALETASGRNAQRVGLYTMGLEVSRIPSWEVAEEIVKAIVNHSKTGSGVSSVLLVASSPIQVSSFQYALNNITTIVPE
jgi:hypothetical protein